jgi:hypothetical protein
LGVDFLHGTVLAQGSLQDAITPGYDVGIPVGAFAIDGIRQMLRAESQKREEPGRNAAPGFARSS